MVKAVVSKEGNEQFRGHVRGVAAIRDGYKCGILPGMTQQGGEVKTSQCKKKPNFRITLPPPDLTGRITLEQALARRLYEFLCLVAL